MYCNGTCGEDLAKLAGMAIPSGVGTSKNNAWDLVYSCVMFVCLCAVIVATLTEWACRRRAPTCYVAAEEHEI
jgi:hypothetical protein